MPSNSTPTHQSSDKRLLWILIAAALVARLATLGLYTVWDTTEARYAEIARKMAELGDWITPWFDYGVPFWGKPPLSFWMTAASFKVLGVNAFAARLPHWICGCVVAWLVWNWLVRRSEREAIYALALITGSVMFLASAGAVTTDMALALGTTLTMRGFWLAIHGADAERLREQYLMFLGLAIGLLAKGPIALVLAGIPMAVWTLRAGYLMRVLRTIHWVRGLLVTCALVVPWYAWAEWRTPGFLEYFLVGEHWQRYVVAGWQGDLYGTAHSYPRGTIWWFAFVSFLPWSILAPIGAWKWRHDAHPVAPEDRSFYLYLLLWALTPCVFFSLAGNILWPYVLPGIPALAMVTALWLARLPRRPSVDRLITGGVAFTAIVFALAIIGTHVTGWNERRSTEALVSDYESHRSDGESLVFFGRLPFSGSFYSGGLAKAVCCLEDLQLRVKQERVFVAIRFDEWDRLPDALKGQLQPVSQRGKYRLFLGEPQGGNP